MIIEWLLIVGMMVMVAPVLLVMAADIFPQYISFQVRSSAVNVYTEIQVVLPLGLVGGAQQNMAIEITKVIWDNDVPEAISATTTQVEAHIATRSLSAVGSFNQPEIVDKINFTHRNQSSTGFELTNARPVFHDLTDSDGKAPIYAAQSLFVGMDTINHTVAKTARGRIFYRMVKVTTQELLGLAAQLTQA